MVLGNGFIMIEELMQLYETKKLESGLCMEKWYFHQRSNKCGRCVKDLAATGPQMLERKGQPKDWSTSYVCKVGNNMLRVFTEETLSVKERSKLAWSAVCFVRLWKTWIEKSTYPIESSFISLQTYNDMIIAGHSLILSMKIFSPSIILIYLSIPRHLNLTAAKGSFRPVVDSPRKKRTYACLNYFKFVDEL